MRLGGSGLRDEHTLELACVRIQLASAFAGQHGRGVDKRHNGRDEDAADEPCSDHAGTSRMRSWDTRRQGSSGGPTRPRIVRFWVLNPGSVSASTSATVAPLLST